MSSFLDEVHEYPPEVEWRVQTEQGGVRGWPVSFASDAGHVKVPRVPHDFIRLVRLRPIARARFIDTDAIGGELIGTRRKPLAR